MLRGDNFVVKIQNFHIFSRQVHLDSTAYNHIDQFSNNSNAYILLYYLGKPPSLLWSNDVNMRLDTASGLSLYEHVSLPLLLQESVAAALTSQ